MKFDFILNVTKNYFRNRLIVIFTNCQIVIQVIQCFKKQFDQYLLQILIRRIEKYDWKIHIHWIFAYVEISSNKTFNTIIKKIIEWKQSNRDFFVFVSINSKIFISTIKNEIRIRAKITRIKIWRIIFIEKIIHRIIKKLIKNVLKKFNKITRFENAIIIQTRTNKIELKDYLYKIKTIEFSKCSCEIRKQMMHHTLLKCSKFDELRKKMWADKREMNLTTFLNIFELTIKIFKYFFCDERIVTI